jgi:hypothetical protein
MSKRTSERTVLGELKETYKCVVILLQREFVAILSAYIEKKIIYPKVYVISRGQFNSHDSLLRLSSCETRSLSTENCIQRRLSLL